MPTIRGTALGVLTVICGLVPALHAGEPALKQGERIVFLGDSITQAGVGEKGYVTLVARQLQEKYPDLKAEVIGAGISGNRVPDLEKRLDRDVLSKKPTLVVIYIGINDVWHSIRDRGTSKEDFDAGLRNIIGQIQKGGARVILCTPTVIGEKVRAENPLKLDAMLDEYAVISRKVAKDTGSHLLDLRQAFQNYLKENNAEDQEKNVLTTDGVHLNDAGNAFVAAQVMVALRTQTPAQTGGEKSTKMLRHIVLFQFKAEVTEKQVQEVVDAFGALPGKIETIKGFEWGTDVSVENKAAGFTHCFVVTFADAKGRDVYLPHPAHQEFVTLVKDRIENVLVFDYYQGQ